MALELGEFALDFLVIVSAVVFAAFVSLVVGLHRRPRATVLGILGLVVFLSTRSVVSGPLVDGRPDSFLGIIFVAGGFLVGRFAFPEDSFEPFDHVVYVRFMQLVSTVGIVVTVGLLGRTLRTGTFLEVLQRVDEFPPQVPVFLSMIFLPGLFGFYGLYDVFQNRVSLDHLRRD